MELIKDPEEALKFTVNQVAGINAPVWYVPSSGGKDSRATAQALLVLIRRGQIRPPQRIVFGMADTMLEFWTFLDQAKKALIQLTNEAKTLGIEADWFMTQPRINDDFWVSILGKGMIPPTPNMRWCTDRLKIKQTQAHMRKLGLADAPVFLGVRYGESGRRDETLQKEAKLQILSCTLGGECGPDYMYNKLKQPKVQPIEKWRQCAVWDFLTLIAPSYGFDNQGLVDHYGPDGSLRYGCWSCPLIYNDRTAKWLSTHNPILYELVTWTDANLRRGGAAWEPKNRELFQASENNDVKDGRLAPHYCKRLYDELLEIGYRHGIELLTQWQRMAIKAEWEWREMAPKGQAPIGGQVAMELATKTLSRPLRITQIRHKVATVLAETVLLDDQYHEAIQLSAMILVHRHGRETWLYGGQWSKGTTWWTCLEDPDLLADVNPYENQVRIDRKLSYQYQRKVA